MFLLVRGRTRKPGLLFFTWWTYLNIPIMADISVFCNRLVFIQLSFWICVLRKGVPWIVLPSFKFPVEMVENPYIKNRRLPLSSTSICVDVFNDIKAYGQRRHCYCSSGPQSLRLQFWESLIVLHVELHAVQLDVSAQRKKKQKRLYFNCIVS